MLIRNRNLGNLPLLEQVLETAVGNRLNLRILCVEMLQKQHAEHSNNDIPEINLFFFIHINITLSDSRASQKIQILSQHFVAHKKCFLTYQSHVASTFFAHA